MGNYFSNTTEEKSSKDALEKQVLKLQLQQEQLETIVLGQGKLLELQQRKLERQQEAIQQQLRQQTLQQTHQQPQVQQSCLVPREWQTEQQQIIVSPEVLSGNGTPGIYSANSAEEQLRSRRGAGQAKRKRRRKQRYYVPYYRPGRGQYYCI